MSDAALCGVSHNVTPSARMMTRTASAPRTMPTIENHLRGLCDFFLSVSFMLSVCDELSFIAIGDIWGVLEYL